VPAQGRKHLDQVLLPHCHWHQEMSHGQSWTKMVHNHLKLQSNNGIIKSCELWEIWNKKKYFSRKDISQKWNMDKFANTSVNKSFEFVICNVEIKIRLLCVQALIEKKKNRKLKFSCRRVQYVHVKAKIARKKIY